MSDTTTAAALLRDSVPEVLRADEKALRALGVIHLSLFGSVARGEERPDSDIDVMVDVDDDLTLFGMSRLKRHLQDVLGRRVDLVEREAIRPAYLPDILADEIAVLLPLDG